MIHPETSRFIQNLQKPYDSSRKPPDSSKNLQKPPETFRNLMIHPDTSRFIQNLQKPSDTFRNFQKPPEISRNLQKSPEISRFIQKCLETSRNLQILPETSRLNQKPSETSRFIQKPCVKLVWGLRLDSDSPSSGRLDQDQSEDLFLEKLEKIFEDFFFSLSWNAAGHHWMPQAG